MARNRMIKKEFWNDEKVGRLSRSARLTLIGSWNLCDDIGVCRGSASFIRSQLYPYDTALTDEMIEAEIQEMIQSKMVVLATYKEEKYLKVKNFKRHQVINRPSQCFTIAGLLKEQIDELFESAEKSSDEEQVEPPSVEDIIEAEVKAAFGDELELDSIEDDSLALALDDAFENLSGESLDSRLSQEDYHFESNLELESENKDQSITVEPDPDYTDAETISIEEYVSSLPQSENDIVQVEVENKRKPKFTLSTVNTS